MGKIRVSQIRKRDGSVVPFQPEKIEQAIYKALAATRAGGRPLAAELAGRVVETVPYASAVDCKGNNHEVE